MSILKKIKLDETTHQIQYTVVAPATGGVITATESNTGDDVNANPQYELDVTVNNTLKKTSGALGTALKVVYEQATAEHGARISLVDQDGASGYQVLSSVLVSDIVAGSIITNTSYDSTTGILTITWDGGSTTQVNLGTLLDIDDVAIKSTSADFLEVTLDASASEVSGSQAQFGVKLAEVTYNTESGELDADTTNGKVLDASEAIPAINNALDAIDTRIDDNERVTAAALNDLQDAISAIKYNISGTTLILAGISQDDTLS